MSDLSGFRPMALCFLALAGFTLSASADQPAKELASGENDAYESTATTGLKASGIAVDRATGRFRNPTAEEARRLAEAMRQYLSDKGRYTENRGAVRHANGMTSMVVPLSRLSFTVVKREEDGSLTAEHVASPDDAAEFLTQKTKTKRPVR